MKPPGPFTDIGVEKTGHVALVEIRRPPNNFFDVALIREIAAAFEALDADAECRALVLAAQGKAFCAGADFGTAARQATAARSSAARRRAPRISTSRATGCSAPKSRSSPRFMAPRSAAGWDWRWWPICA